MERSVMLAREVHISEPLSDAQPRLQTSAVAILTSDGNYT